MTTVNLSERQLDLLAGVCEVMKAEVSSCAPMLRSYSVLTFFLVDRLERGRQGCQLQDRKVRPRHLDCGSQQAHRRQEGWCWCWYCYWWW